MKTNKRFKVIILMLIALISGVVIVTPSVTASSIGHDFTPKSMRGTWYRWVPKTEDVKGHLYKNKVTAKAWSTNSQGDTTIGVWKCKYKGKTGYYAGGANASIQENNVLTKVKVGGKYHKVVVSYLTDQVGDFGYIQYDFRSKFIAKKYGKKHALSFDYTTVKPAKIKKQMKKVVVKYFGKQYVYNLN